MDERKRRIAENETRFRAINQRLSDDLQRLEVAGGHVSFVCECGSSECTQPIELTVEEYGDVRRDPMAFVVARGHEIDDTEDIVRTAERFTIVRKHDEAAPFVLGE